VQTDDVPPPPSPCNKVCALDGDGFCLGCFRTGDEIARWRDMSAAEQWRLIERLEERRKQRGAPLSPPGSTPPGGGSNES